eukprot:Rhum_TRINITY_DN14824_c10_g5::Rhum_TRINITY_DN14824_c10_g5_i1::g.119399::m.119399
MLHQPPRARRDALRAALRDVAAHTLQALHKGLRALPEQDGLHVAVVQRKREGLVFTQLEVPRLLLCALVFQAQLRPHAHQAVAVVAACNALSVRNDRDPRPAPEVVQPVLPQSFQLVRLRHREAELLPLQFEGLAVRHVVAPFVHLLDDPALVRVRHALVVRTPLLLRQLRDAFGRRVCVGRACVRLLAALLAALLLALLALLALCAKVSRSLVFALGVRGRRRRWHRGRVGVDHRPLSVLVGNGGVVVARRRGRVGAVGVRVEAVNVRLVLQVADVGAERVVVLAQLADLVHGAEQLRLARHLRRRQPVHAARPRRAGRLLAQPILDAFQALELLLHADAPRGQALLLVLPLRDLEHLCVDGLVQPHHFVLAAAAVVVAALHLAV